MLAMPLAACACSQLLGLDDAVVEAEPHPTHWAAPSVVIADAEVRDAAPDAVPARDGG